MTISEAIASHVVADAGVSALIGSRLYAELPPQDCTRPFAVYHIRIDPSEDTLPGLLQLVATVEITAVSGTYDEAFQIAEALRSALAEFSGNLGGSFPVEDIAFSSTEGDVYPEQGLFGTTTTFLVQYPA